jgi:hypothetical protein
VGPGLDLYTLGLSAVELLKGPAFDHLFQGVAGAAGAEVARMR